MACKVGFKALNGTMMAFSGRGTQKIAVEDQSIQ
jgi:hypothetical protein